MKVLGQITGIVFAVLVAVGLPYAGYVLIKAGTAALATMDSGSTAGLLTAAFAGLVSVLTLVLGKRYEANQTALAEIRAKKVPVYEALLKFMFRVLWGAKIDKPVPEEEVEAFFADFTQHFMVWASTDVLKAWSAFRSFSMNADNKAEVMFMMEDVVRAIRKDLGHGDLRLERGDLLKLFITDVATLLKK